jgi:predicted RNA-binding protein with PUA-like domain
MSRKHWMVKQEPDTYSWNDLEKEGQTDWTGVRNFQARNYLREMKAGDGVLFYHSGKEKAVVGVAEVVREPYADPTAKEGDWVAVDIKAVGKLREPMTLGTMRAEEALQSIPLLKQSQLSVMPVSKQEFDYIVKKGRLVKS